MMDHVKSACHEDHLDCPCTIFKVPEHIRQLDPKAYDPIVVPLGPFRCAHWSHSSVTLDHKRRYVWHLLSRHDGSEERANQLLKECLMELKKRDKMVRHCYHPELPRELDAHNLASIMLLDGCFIIYLMLKMHAGKKGMDEETEEDESKKRREWKIEMGEDGRVLNVRKGHEQLEVPTVAGLFTINLVVYDLLKLENQIPFFIIELLFNHLKTPKDGQIGLVKLALQLFEGILPEESESFKKKEKRCPGEYHHLLHLFYSSRIFVEKPQQHTSTPGCFHRAIKCMESKWKKSEVAIERTKSKGKETEAAIECNKSKGKKVQSSTSAPKWTPSATELDRAGVKFKVNKKADTFLDITFEQRKMEITPLLCLLKLYLMFRSGRMEIPPLQIYDYTGPLFQNLIAFEQCYLDSEMYFTTYALFMDCIIDKAEDVRLLHLEGILEHKLSSDRAVAEFFNKLGCQIHFTRKKNYLKNQIKRVNEFYDSRWHKWLAGLRRDYLGNPWAILSVLAAIFLLLLTIEQAVFSALSYLHSS
ncbi:UPF0481 protein [Cocos nucifera]|uniref:UPF0481 protein n=1 Tax=Cocos nucifera TaxID=13894 RepID=A0A8K0HWW7_COCNU|nr:UPF0481 protein [Cocos nucifera]